MGTLWQDLKYAVWALLRNRALTVVAALSLALGIGANSAIFCLVDTFLRPLPVRDEEQLVRVFTGTKKLPEQDSSYLDFVHFRDQNTVFSGLLAYSRRGALLRSGVELELVFLNVVSRNYFSVLGVVPVVGAGFLAEGGADTEPSVVISYSLWQRQFGKDPGVIGRRIELSGKTHTVGAVAPARFHGLDPPFAPDVWMPVKAWGYFHGSASELERRDLRQFEIVGRMRPGVPIERAEAEMDILAARLAAAYPETNKGRQALVVGERQHRTSGFAKLALLFMTLSGLVLLICCANVANLLLARAETRRGEIAIRAALGAGRARIVRQVFTEGLLLALLGGAIGLALAFWLVGLLPSLMPPAIIRLVTDFRIDARVLAFTMSATLLTSVVFGLAPAWHALRLNLIPALKGVASGRSRGRGRLAVGNVLVVGQVAVCVVMLAASGLLVRSFVASSRIHPGFEKKNMLLLELLPGLAGYKRQQTIGLYEQLTERIEALPGVKRVSHAIRAPLSGSGGGLAVKVVIPGYEVPAGEDLPSVKYNSVGLNYFATIGTRILRGRDFDRRDGPDSSQVVLISETMARRFWPTEDPIGRQIRVGGPNGMDRRIIGVVEDVKINRIHEPPEPYMYLPWAQASSNETTFLIETAGEPASMAELVRGQLRALDPEMPIYGLTTMDSLMRFALNSERRNARVVSILGLLGLLLAAVGLYGVVSYAVSRRTREIGVRAALGAQKRDVLRLVLREGLALGLLGAAIGLAGALASTRLLAGLLHGVSPSDALSLGAATFLVILVTLGASYIPALRASKVDPLVALRYE